MRSELDEFARWYRSWELYKDSPDADKIEKKTLDAKALADRMQVAYGKTPLLDAVEIQDHELGKGSLFSFNQGFSQISFSEIAYREGLLAYKPEQIFGEEPDVEFVYWKTEDKAAYVPELKDVRESVIAVWKRTKAVALAQKAAEEKAKQAEGKESLKAAFGEGVLETSEFSWMTAGAVPFSSGAPSISRVQNVEMPGSDFMQSVFKLKTGSVGAAINHPQTIVYVVRVVRESPSEEVLRQRFLQAGANFEVAHLASMEAQTSVAEWFQDLQDEMKVKWRRGADSMALEDSGE